MTGGVLQKAYFSVRVPKDALDPRDRNKLYQTILQYPVVNSAVVDSRRLERTPMCVFRPVDKEEDAAEY